MSCTSYPSSEVRDPEAESDPLLSAIPFRPLHFWPLIESSRHKSILSYLHSAGMRETYDALKRETDNEEFQVDDPKAKWVGLLEKKWTSVIRLQKKVHQPGLSITSRLTGRSWTLNPETLPSSPNFPHHTEPPLHPPTNPSYLEPQPDIPSHRIVVR